MPHTIHCDIHDHFEIACMKKLLVDITLQDNTVITGHATGLENKNGEEYILINTKTGCLRINLIHIHTLLLVDTGLEIAVF